MSFLSRAACGMAMVVGQDEINPIPIARTGNEKLSATVRAGTEYNDDSDATVGESSLFGSAN